MHQPVIILAIFHCQQSRLNEKKVANISAALELVNLLLDLKSFNVIGFLSCPIFYLLSLKNF